MAQRILIVDDDNALLSEMVAFIRDAGFDVAAAHDYKMALEVLEDGLPLALLLTDVRLPDVHGFAIARMARMHHHDLKVVYISGYDVPADEARGPVLRKPIPPEMLLGQIRATLSEPAPS